MSGIAGQEASGVRPMGKNFLPSALAGKNSCQCKREEAVTVQGLSRLLQETFFYYFMYLFISSSVSMPAQSPAKVTM